MKKRIPVIIFAAVMLAFVACTLSACDYIDKLINGDKKSVRTPEITSVTTIKTDEGYLTSKEYLFNQGCTNPMALNDAEKFYIVLTYDNPDKLSVSSVKINGTKIDSTKFVPGSDYSQTKIEYEIEDSAQTEIRSYVINNVMYINGTETTKMRWAENVENTVSVSVRPQFRLTLNAMNVDYRMANENRLSDEKEVASSEPKSIYYDTELSYVGVSSPDYTGETAVGVSKNGGWVFAGWYTKPNGEGELVKSTDKYYFWCDMTLYAHYERMYELEIVELNSPIVYTYGANRTYRFLSGAIVKNRDFKEYELTHYPTLEIPDTVVVEEITYTETVGNYGLPVYAPKVSYTEYPVIKIDNLAFKGFNTIETASVGKYVEEIGYGAFWECTKINSFAFPDDSALKYIGDYAFRNTKALGVSTPFGLPDKVEYLGNLAFRDSGWAYVPKAEGGGGTSTLTFKSTWKYVGYKCFMNTKFTQVDFEPGCHFEGQISDAAGKAIESKEGNRTLQLGQNLIGSRLFASCLQLNRVQFLSTDGANDGLNIIPDYCFDIENYENDETKIAYIQNVFFAEGLTYIGQRAFYYQKKIPTLDFPASLEEVDKRAFYQNESVTEIGFGGADSQLKILHMESFGHLINLDSCTITSSVFEKYGSGVFSGCDRMKCVIFENAEFVPVGYLKGERVDEEGKDLEVVAGHVQADFLWATGEAGNKESVNDDPNNQDAKTYSSPLRIFCPAILLNDFEKEMKAGKEMSAGNVSTGTSAYNSSVFVHSLENLKDYTYIGEDGKEITVKVAVQEIYKAAASGDKPVATTTIVGYSIVYWSERSTYVKLPTSDQLNINYPIIEIAHYALPTSVNRVYIPKEYTRIAHDAFNSCTALADVEFEDIDTLEYIGDYAFFGTGIKNFVGGKNLAVIGQYAFQRCLSLKWVDLRDTPIVNEKNGSLKIRDLFKYEYELKDEEKDYRNSLGYGAFKGCSSLEWIYLPKVKQITSDTFTNCKKLKTVIIPTLGSDIDTNTSATNDDAFYQYGQPTTVYDPSIIHQLHIIVDSSAATAHSTIFDIGPEIDDGYGNKSGYGTIAAENTQRPE